MWDAGLFSKRASEELSPISQDRIKQVFDREGWPYTIDSDGDMGTNWGDFGAYYTIMGKSASVLWIFGQWTTHPDAARLEDVRLFIANWQRSKTWPRCYCNLDDDGDLRVQTDLACDWEAGATDTQLIQQIKRFLKAGNEFYDALGKRLGI